jgi:hypothetical protein
VREDRPPARPDLLHEPRLRFSAPDVFDHSHVVKALLIAHLPNLHSLRSDLSPILTSRCDSPNGELAASKVARANPSLRRSTMKYAGLAIMALFVLMTAPVPQASAATAHHCRGGAVWVPGVGAAARGHCTTVHTHHRRPATITHERSTTTISR